MTSGHTLLPNRFVLTDTARGGDPFEQLKTLSAADALILRHYELPKPDRLSLALCLREATRARKVRLLIAGDYGLASCVGADGLHLPSWMTKRGDVWSHRQKAGWIITAAAHDEPELRAASRAGADAALVSPVFPTGSHPGTQTLGVIRLARLTATARIPIYALGGVTALSLKRLRNIPKLSGWASVSAP
ncbi:thiamine phosphate synthase [Parvibaculaceae bacterium PLY_AMNH_Bact1]|nr:thiamine phosphate synthase [Parvibaculaceae bacterium PLY_AMNH_Bact1]